MKESSNSTKIKRWIRQDAQMLARKETEVFKALEINKNFPFPVSETRSFELINMLFNVPASS